MLVVLLLISISLNGAYSKCSLARKVVYVQNNFGSECQIAVLSIIQPDLPLDNINFNSACTSGCLGKYTIWLETECDDRSGAMLTRMSCLKNNIIETSGNNIITRCRFSFPDVANDVIFTSTQQCGAILQQPPVTCPRDCREPINSLIDNFGCCFLSLYNSSESVSSLLEEGFLDENRATVLNLFQMSGILETCRQEAIPPACDNEPFPSRSHSASLQTTSWLSHFLITLVYLLNVSS